MTEVGPTGASGTTSSTTNAEAVSIAYWDGKTRRAKVTRARWLGVVRGIPPTISRTPTAASPLAARDRARVWHARAVAAWRLATNPPKLDAWYCIHHYEGSWADPNAPYWGGLQMDLNFQAAYGPWLLRHKGTADHWSPLQQIWAGVRAWRVRGFEPWSTTAHACGVY
ncbi:MAG: Transglycosylase-like domain [Gaiellaceae bacterium]|jgi:hypothetical protein|nr:Transglycosylase-like domain [Gaiellaceae bacterium]